MFRMGKEEAEAVAKVIESGKLFKVNDGPYKMVENFEKALREKLSCKYTICMTSGKGALISALIGMGIGPGDEVIVPAYTYISSAIAVTAVGAIPVISEIDRTMTLDPASLESRISKHTRAIMPVHMQGFPANLEKITEIARKHGLFVLEDACQAVGGSYKGRRLGTVGDAGAYSFNYYKIISAGEGGAFISNDRTIFERALIYHDSSAICYFGNQMEGVKEESFCGSEFRVGEITGAILVEQLKRLDGILYDLRKNKKLLIEAIAKSGLSVAPTNDAEGDCGTAVALSFDKEEDTRKVAAAAGGTIPIDTGKHVYRNWDCIINKRGAINPAFDPFLNPLNKGLDMDYSADVCPRTLDILRKTLYIQVSPDWKPEDIAARADRIIKAAEAL